MKIFNQPNMSDDWKCPICKTSKKGKVVLVGIIGTSTGNNIQAEQVHLDCLELLYDKESQIIYQKLD